MLLQVLGFIAVGLTIAMFYTKESMLGFPCALFWAILGGFCYGESAATWDINYLMAFAYLLGMVPFTIFGAWGLREPRDSIGDEDMEQGEGGYIDEDDGGKRKRRFGLRRTGLDDEYEKDMAPWDSVFSTDSDESDVRKRAAHRRSALHDRAEARRRVRG